MGHDQVDPEVLAARKVALRASARAARRELGIEARRAASEATVARLRSLPELRHVNAVLLYAASSDEVDLRGLVPWLRGRGVDTRFPRVAGDHLEVVPAPDVLALQISRLGIGEPTGAAVDVDDLDVVLVPGVAFDPNGGRLGQGGGHYDRLLAILPETTLRIGVAFACQVVPRVPLTDLDEPVDLVVTERATYRTDARHITTEA